MPAFVTSMEVVPPMRIEKPGKERLSTFIIRSRFSLSGSHFSFNSIGASCPKAEKFSWDPRSYEFSVSFARFFKSDFFKDILKSCFDAFFFFSRKWGIVFTSPTVAITKDGAIDRQNIKILHMFGRTWETVQN